MTSGCCGNRPGYASVHMQAPRVLDVVGLDVQSSQSRGAAFEISGGFATAVSNSVFRNNGSVAGLEVNAGGDVGAVLRSHGRRGGSVVRSHRSQGEHQSASVVRPRRRTGPWRQKERKKKAQQ